MDAPGTAETPRVVDAETIRLQAEEHPLIEDTPPASTAEHCLRLMHLRAYDEAVAHAAGCDVLDVGCNTGYGTVRFMPVAGRVVGVDVSPGAIEAARQRASDGRPEFVLTSGFEMPFPAHSFDLVTSFQVLEHVPDPLAYLREIDRVTRPGGTVILATPNAAIRLDPGMTPWNRFHVHEYLATELRDLLVQVFPQVRIRGMFGTATLYETEIRRVDAARQRIRRKNEAARQAATRQAATRQAATRQAATRQAATRQAATRPAASKPVRAARPLPIRVARRLLPSPVRAWLRSMVMSATRLAAQPELTPAPAQASSPTDGSPSMDLESFLRFSVADLFYADTDLDRAMDLLAICRLESPPTEG